MSHPSARLAGVHAMALIIRMAKRYSSMCWYNYDRAFRLEAAASNLKDWSQLRPDLYSYHTSNDTSSRNLAPPSANRLEPRGDPRGSELCRSWNVGSCSSPRETCRFRHSCNRFGCGGPVPTEKSTVIVSLGIQQNAFKRADLSPNEHRSIELKNNIGVMSSSPLLFTETLPKAHMVTPINIINFEIHLTAHPDRRKVDYVLYGLRNGFHIGFQPLLSKLKAANSNCPSTYEHASIIDNYLAKEVRLGRVFGPTSNPPIADLHISRFGVIPKKRPTAGVLFSTSHTHLSIVLTTV